jgi:hypothetical protein
MPELSLLRSGVGSVNSRLRINRHEVRRILYINIAVASRSNKVHMTIYGIQHTVMRRPLKAVIGLIRGPKETTVRLSIISAGEEESPACVARSNELFAPIV